MVLGPSRSGKTTGVILPNVIAAGGPVVSTSTKDDVMVASSTQRQGHGPTYLFDPSGEVSPAPGVQHIAWSPLRASARWEGALRMATAMVESAGPGTQQGDHHWRERATALLGPLLFAAGAGQSMEPLLEWVDGRDGVAALELLDQRGLERHPSARILEGILATEARELSGIWSTTASTLSAYRYPAALASTQGAPLDPASFVSSAGTLYICSPSSVQRSVAPIVVGLLEEVKEAAFTHHARERGATPTLFALDEVANIAPMRGLPALVSEGGGQGVLTLACLQDLSQAQARWGSQGRGFLSLFPVTMVLPGIADVATLRDLSAIVGEVAVPQVTSTPTGNPLGVPRRSISTQWRPRLSPSEIAQGHEGHALVLDARRQAGWVRLERVFAREARSRPGLVRGR